MTEITLYHKKENIEVEINNQDKLKFEFVEDTKKEYGKALKVTRLNDKGEKEKATYINEGDLVLLYDLYVYKKENNEEIF